MKKIALLVMAFSIFFAFTMPDEADARRGGYSSGKKSFTQTNKAKPTENVNKSQTNQTNTSTTNAANTNRGFMSGGSLMKGLMIGGLAGLLFGSLFANLGFLGDFLGLLVNLIAIYILFVAVRAIWNHFKERKKAREREDYYR